MTSAKKTAELQRDRDQVLAGVLHDQAAGGRLAGERDLGDALVLRERFARSTPKPLTMLSTPGGRMSATSSASTMIDIGVCSAGLSTTQLPAASAGASFHTTISRVHFVPTNPGHNAEIIPGFVPDGVTEPAGVMGKEYVLTLLKPGLYGIKCKPHYSMGMVALVKVGAGAAPNAATAAAVKFPPLAAKRMTPMVAQAK
jgi:pseudoazurin